MGQRNMPCINQMIEMDQQGQGYFYPPAINLGHTTNFQQPNVRTMETASRSSTNFEIPFVPERYDNTVFYGMTQYNGVHHHHHHNLDLNVAAPGNVYYAFMPPSSGGVLPVPLNHGASDQMPSSSNYGVGGGISAEEYGRTNHFIDGARGGPCKRKLPEGVHGNYQHFNASATPSSSVPPLNARHPGGVAVSDPSSFPLPPHYMGNGIPSIMEVGPQNGSRNRLVAAGLDCAVMHDHNHNHLAQGNYAGQHFQPSGIWLEQHISSNSGDGSAQAWNQAPNLSLMHGNNLSVGSMETAANMGMQRYHEAVNSRSSQSLRQPLSVNHHQTHHALPPPMLGPRNHNNSAAASHRFSSNSSRSNTSSSQNGLEIGHRHAGSVPPTGIRIYRPHRGITPDNNTLRQQHLAHLRILHADEVAILELPDLYEVGEFPDHHSDMRLDIEDMSYEELLALGERIGNVNTGLSEDTITSQLKTRAYLSSRMRLNLEEAECHYKEDDCCIICQDDYKSLEKIGILNCGHEYHAECLKKWLLIKNVCPVCKSEALST
ncbi:probable E3 ubiquitin-protein ligase ZFP1 isoform X1 [Humulus lupulus]|uniref:probable E3 ubiquitin-protein ligase ZFP1 isoform X1 n=1 Tax=Humulus lupulus TaxID=3486 RepID=UPI002B4122EF|nr:probable E3 ubiquitin-protein ligase ZFP1 isoform X1 [Humulus lupulus]